MSSSPVSNITTIYKPLDAARYKVIQAELAKRNVEVKLLPDGISRKGDNYTGFKSIFPAVNFRLDKSSKITSFSLSKYKISISTSYKKAGIKQLPSAYGMGTKPLSRNSFLNNLSIFFGLEYNETSLQYHESRHGMYFLYFLYFVELPDFKGKVGMARGEFEKHYKDYKEALKNYETKMNSYNTLSVDCVGTSIDKFKNTNMCSSISI
jgi:hypothetical protein